MKLYTYDPAPSPQRLGLFLKYKGIEIDTRQVDMVAEEQLGEDYRAIVPDQTVPALVLDDGTVLTEVIGQCLYLESLYPEKPLLGTSGLERALVISWMHKLALNAFMPVAEILRNGNPKFAGRALAGPLDLEQIPQLAERGRIRLAHAWNTLDQTVSGRTWLAGDRFSQADIDVAVIAGFSGWVKAKPPQELTELHSYLARVQAELG